MLCLVFWFLCVLMNARPVSPLIEACVAIQKTERNAQKRMCLDVRVFILVFSFMCFVCMSRLCGNKVRFVLYCACFCFLCACLFCLLVRMRLMTIFCVSFSRSSYVICHIIFCVSFNLLCLFQSSVSLSIFCVSFTTCFQRGADSREIPGKYTGDSREIL